MIDEYQDTNKPQYELMKLLAGDHGNVCVVGDEDQSIYSWRGADIKNILDFEKDFPETRTIRLEQNYRSTQMILEGASAVVAQNTQRKGKKPLDRPRRRLHDRALRSARRRKRKRSSSPIASRSTFAMPSRSKPTSPPAAPCSTAPTRSRAWSKKRCAATRSSNHMVGGFSFYDRAEVKDILSYMKLVQNPARQHRSATQRELAPRAASAKPPWKPSSAWPCRPA